MVADFTVGNWPKRPPHLPVLQGRLLSLALLLPSQAALGGHQQTQQPGSRREESLGCPLR